MEAQVPREKPVIRSPCATGSSHLELNRGRTPIYANVPLAVPGEPRLFVVWALLFTGLFGLVLSQGKAQAQKPGYPPRIDGLHTVSFRRVILRE